MAFIKLGRKENIGGVAPSNKSRVYYPTLYIDNKAAPVSGKDIGKTIVATVQLKLKGTEASQSENTNVFLLI